MFNSLSFPCETKTTNWECRSTVVSWASNPISLFELPSGRYMAWKNHPFIYSIYIIIYIIIYNDSYIYNYIIIYIYICVCGWIYGWFSNYTTPPFSLEISQPCLMTPKATHLQPGLSAPCGSVTTRTSEFLAPRKGEKVPLFFFGDLMDVSWDFVDFYWDVD